MEVPLSNFSGYRVKAADGYIGTISDFYFDVRLWKIPFVVVDATEWLKREIILSSNLLLPINESTKTFPAKVTRGRLNLSCNNSSDAPSCNQATDHLSGSRSFNRFNESVYLSVVSSGCSASLCPTDRRIRRATTLTGLVIKSPDTVLGNICDFILEDSTWQLRYLVIKVWKIISARYLLIDTKNLKNIKWTEDSLELNL